MISLPIPDKNAPTSCGAIHREGISIGELVDDLTRVASLPTIVPISIGSSRRAIARLPAGA